MLKELAKDFDFAAKDYTLCTPLHLAATSAKPKSLLFLLEQPGVDRCLTERNFLGLTPLESLEESITSNREFYEAFGIKRDRKGCSAEQMECMTELKRRMGLLDGLNTSELLLEAQMDAYGCKCRQCVAGTLSPRMMFELLCKGF